MKTEHNQTDATLAAPHSQPVRGVPDDEQCDRAAALALDSVAAKMGVYWNEVNTDTNGHSAWRRALVRAGFALAAAPSPAAQPVAPAAPTYWNSQRKMISRAIIGLRDGWATRKDADDALAALEVAASVSPQGAQVGGQPMCEGCDDLAMPLPGGGFGLCQACIDFGKDEQPHSTATEGADGMGGGCRMNPLIAFWLWWLIIVSPVPKGD